MVRKMMMARKREKRRRRGKEGDHIRCLSLTHVQPRENRKFTEQNESAARPAAEWTA